MQKNQGVNFLGRVVDQQKQAPISGAKVLLNFPGAPPVVYTDLEGLYRFTVQSDSNLKGQITIEAKGYRTYHSFIKLLPDKRDLGDIRLLHPDSETRILTSSTESSSILMPIIVAIITVLAITVAVFTRHSPPHEAPLEIPVKTQKNRTIHHRRKSSLVKVAAKYNQYIVMLAILSNSNVISKVLKTLNYRQAELCRRIADFV